MKSRLTALILTLSLSPVTAFPQTTVLFDNFEDRDLTVNPAWSGDLDDFMFETDTLAGQETTLLRLDTSPDPTRTQIVTRSNTATGSWEFYVRQDFNPSNFNRAFIFLMADRADLNYLDGSDVSGYALRTGDNDSPRRFRLVRFDEGNQTVLAESDTIIEEGTGYSIRVSRSEDGVWRIYMAPGYNSIPILDAGSVTDQTYEKSSHFGILMRYSSGNISNFYFDNIRIENSAPFRLISADVISAAVVELQFSYPVDQATLQTSDVTLSSLGSPIRAESGSSPNAVLLTYPEMIPDGEYTIQVENLNNIYGDALNQPAEVTFSFTNPFSLVSAEITSGRTAALLFSRFLNADSTIPSDFTINQNLSPATILIDSSRVELQFNGDLPSGEIIISIGNIESADGWRLPGGTSVSTYRFGDASPGDIAINEFLYRRAPPDDAQFIELYNTTNSPFDLSRWSVRTDRGSAEIPPGTILGPSGYLLLSDRKITYADNSAALELPGFVPLRTTGDAIVLRNIQSVTIDSLTYKPEWGGDDPGISLERKDPKAITIDPVNWASSIAASGSTPLYENSRFERDEKPPALLFATLLPGDNIVLLRFDEFINQDLVTDLMLNRRRASVTGLNGNIGNELIVEAGNLDSEPRREILLEMSSVSDYQGNISGSLQQPVAQPLSAGDLVFNEIMFDPLDDDFDQLPNQSDYLELINRRAYAISLEGVLLHDQTDENGEVREMRPLSSRSKWIPAKEFALIYPEPEPAGLDSSRTGQFFNLAEFPESAALQIERSTLSLPLSGREIYLSDSLGTVIDMLHYSDEWHNPNLIDTRGIALERINPGGDTTDNSNWGSSAVPAGGTPGFMNSLFQEPETSNEVNSLRLGPNPFSPDGDGHEDHLFISYSFDDPNYMLRVRIFDRHGRHIRTLADSHHAGFEGSLTWDGRNAGGVTGRIGIYIVHIEAFNSSTGNKKQFREVAVLARQF